MSLLVESIARYWSLSNSRHDTRRVELPPGAFTSMLVGVPPLESPTTSWSPMMMGAVGMPASMGREPIGSSLPFVVRDRCDVEVGEEWRVQTRAAESIQGIDIAGTARGHNC